MESGYLKAQLVGAHAERRAKIESGEITVVGVNKFTETEPNPLTADLDAAIQTVDPAVEQHAVAALKEWREQRDNAAVEAALARLRQEAVTEANLMDATLECVRAGATTGEWAGVLREVFGEFRAPTGVCGVGTGTDRRPRTWPCCAARWIRPLRSSAAGCGCSSASPAWTATPTAPSRSRCGPATPGSRSCTRASGSRRRRSPRRR